MAVSRYPSESAERRWLLRPLHGYAGRGPVAFLYVLIVALVIGAAIWSPSFFTSTNIADILRSSVLIGLVAIGQTVVILTGGIDFSIGVNAKVVSVAAASLFPVFDGNVLVVALISLAIGAAIGAINGLIVTRLYANPFIVTFGMYSVLTGVALIISSTPVGGVPKGFQEIYSAQAIGPVTWCVFGMAAVWVISWIILTRSGFGRAIYAVGGSRRVAELAGVNARRTMLGSYVWCGVCGAAAGLFLLSQSGVADLTDNGLEFTAIVAAAVGGISLLGGVGTLVGTLGGVLLLAIVSNVLIIGQVSEFYQQLVIGAIILIAVATFKQRR